MVDEFFKDKDDVLCRLSKVLLDIFEWIDSDVYLLAQKHRGKFRSAVSEAGPVG